MVRRLVCPRSWSSAPATTAQVSEEQLMFAVWKLFQSPNIFDLKSVCCTESAWKVCIQGGTLATRGSNFKKPSNDCVLLTTLPVLG